ncbi:MAG: ATP-binding cassette domain-containing protein, partial [SAR324 cluster bacterium]|nr:ATP-binding cassette domain-containing protein [SAR324 cluster bacterium]
MLQTHGLSKHFGGLHAVEDVELAIPHGEIRAIIGPNGAGKTTLLRMIATLGKPTAGRVIIRGIDIRQEPERVRSEIGL